VRATGKEIFLIDQRVENIETFACGWEKSTKEENTGLVSLREEMTWSEAPSISTRTEPKEKKSTSSSSLEGFAVRGGVGWGAMSSITPQRSLGQQREEQEAAGAAFLLPPLVLLVPPFSLATTHLDRLGLAVRRRRVFQAARRTRVSPPPSQSLREQRRSECNIDLKMNKEKSSCLS
jgi:hypothetical protein